MKKTTKHDPRRTVRRKPLLSREQRARFKKQLDRIVHPPPKAIQFRVGPSISARVKNVHTFVTLISAAAATDPQYLGHHQVLEAIERAANKALDDLYGLSLLPESVGNLPALTDDEYRDQGVPDKEDQDGYVRARMREMLDGAQ